MTTRGPASIVVAALLALSLTACTPQGDDTPEPSASISTFSASSTPSVPTATDAAPVDPSATPVAPSAAPVDPDEVPVPVPSGEAEGWTDARAYDACRNEATRSQGGDYRWNDRSSQVLVQSSAGRTMDVSGVYSGGDVGVANVTYRCVVGGTPDAPQLSGSVVN